MITTKKLIACWVGLGITTAVSFKIFDKAEEEAREASRSKFRYVELSDTQLIQMRYEKCHNSPSFRAELATYGSSCEKLYSNASEEMINSARIDYKSDLAHKAFEDSWPEIKKLNSMQEIFCYATAFAAVVVFLLWFKSVLLPRLVAVKDVVKERTPSASDLKALGANRKVRQAESDFQTAKNLHDNGLISDEMFEKRKTELKESLSANKVFQE